MAELLTRIPEGVEDIAVRVRRRGTPDMTWDLGPDGATTRCSFRTRVCDGPMYRAYSSISFEEVHPEWKYWLEQKLDCSDALRRSVSTALCILVAFVATMCVYR